ncbi:MAG: tetratricopeptide repeat protein, partial [Sulfurihydrogenibium sp.]|nr:tetratricopeptide repeat protein [Sulfurihydrogenibium sp.]
MISSFRETLDKYFYIKIATLIAFTPLVSYAIEKEDITLQKVNKELSKQIKISKVYDEELLKLILITFLGNQDLENAYIVAKKGAELFPNNPYWLKNLGQVAIWTKRPAEGIEAYLKLYQITKDENTKRELFNLALATNRFDIAINLVEKDALSGKFNDLKTLLYIYQQAGEVKKLTEILEAMYEKDKNIDILRNLTMILYNYGNLDKASKYGEILYSRQDKNYKDVLLYSSILYAKKDLKKSLEVLKSYIPNITVGKDIEEDKLEYLYTLSDLAWALRDFDTSINIAVQLDKIDKGRLAEYIRLYTHFYYKKEYKLSADYALKGYEKYKDFYLLSGYIESL